MRVALFTDGITPYVIGGMQRHSFYLAKYLAANQVYVDLYHYNASPLDIQQLEVFSLEEQKYIHSIVVPFPKLDSLPGHYIRESYAYSKSLHAEYLKRPPVDFIYTKGFTGWYLMEQKKKNPNQYPPVGVKFHGYEMFQPPPDFKGKLINLLFLQKPVKRINLLADVVFSYGSKITDLIKSIGVPSKNIIELPSGVQLEWVKEEATVSHQPVRFVFMGRNERRKGVLELNQALTQLLQLQLDFLFTFIGPIPPEQQIKDSRITYLGEIRDSAQIKALLDDQDILVCPSHAEGMPNVILEGCSRGLAIIATDVGATGIMVDQNNGWLLPKPEVDMITNALKSAIALNTDELFARKKYSARRIKENFVWDVIAKKLISEIQKRV